MKSATFFVSGDSASVSVGADDLVNALRVGLEAPTLLTAAFLHATAGWTVPRATCGWLAPGR